jgi:hypothetical protein
MSAPPASRLREQIHAVVSDAMGLIRKRTRHGARHIVRVDNLSRECRWSNFRARFCASAMIHRKNPHECQAIPHSLSKRRRTSFASIRSRRSIKHCKWRRSDPSLSARRQQQRQKCPTTQPSR